MGTIAYGPTELPTGDTVLVTAASDSATTIGHLFVTNTTDSAATVTVTIHRAISGNVEAIANAVSVAANSAQDLLDPAQLTYGALVLMPNDTLHGSAGTASAVTLTATN